ncbi:putative comE operon protein 1 [Clostridium bornimense]|uniref:Putative comE operon protein 1 n=1 Tax=Clostridium bornimense TaxID=1216932 RepID=W6SG22_9CLOT|nr:helix-hairpin-helix domain-containing protein [Clostridium bornimense]CDM68650.1 putative comE operon protein 1 [Clostridium bornimense]
MKEFFNKYKILIIVVICLLGFLLIFSNFNSSINDEEDAFKKYSKETEIKEDSEDSYTEKNKEEEIFVYIGGAVVKPNVYKLMEGSRIKDLVQVAGGFLDNAESKDINLAQKLNDEDYIYVYSVGESEVDATIDSVVNSSIRKDGCININKATVEELKSIDGIGEVRASKIVEYREENGPYKNIDELKTIGARIGEKTFETIKDKVYVP